ncbi:MAG: outer membrane protein assembly factor BamD [Alphaproteobacteria bacterium]|nr:outer membrane protein assembly factor BamD [Alphaproteobacteria bacterium]
MQKKNYSNIILAILIAFSLVGCASSKAKDPSKIKQVGAQELYTKASNAFKEKRYKKSASLYADITYQFPYYKWAARSRIMEIYSYYLMKDYDSAIYAVDNFISMHPAAKEVPYAYYMKALSYYEQIDIPYRDQGMTMKARQAFFVLITKFPKSSYAKDARVKLELIDDHLAAQEMIVGRYYINTGNILAAIKRFKVVVDEYSTTSQIEEALYRMVEGYVFLGVKKEAERNAAVLYHNYPNSKWYKESYNLIQKMPNKK